MSHLYWHGGQEDFRKHFGAVSALVSNMNRFTAGGVYAHERWEDELRNTDYTIHDLLVQLTYQDSKGHRVSLLKSQELIARKDKVIEIWDRNLKSDGSFDWDGAQSLPGKVRCDKMRKLGTSYEIPTVFDSPLPVGKKYHRELRVDFIDAFKERTEDLVFTSERPVNNVTIKIVGSGQGIEFSNAVGEVRFGCYTMEPPQRPEIYDKEIIIWNISDPQIGEIHRLKWTRTEHQT